MINPKTDLELLPNPSDGISDVSFSPIADLICVASWDSKVKRRCFFSGLHLGDQ